MKQLRILFANCLLLLISAYSISLAQDPTFQREVDTIPVFIVASGQGQALPVTQPFAGGFSTSKLTLADIDDDGDFDLFAGDSDGSMRFFRNIGTASDPNFTFETDSFADIDVGNKNAPAFGDIDNDGDLDLFVGDLFGNIAFFRNTGTATNPTYTLEAESLVSIDGLVSTPTLADIDNDGDLDLFVGGSNGNIAFFRNTGTPTNHNFTLETDDFVPSSGVIGDFSAPTFADIDGDGDLDLFVGDVLGIILFFRNTGTVMNPNFTLVTDMFAGIDIGDNSAPTFADIDDAGDLDMFVGAGDGNIRFFRNTGSASTPNFIPSTSITDIVTINLGSVDIGNLSALIFADIDGDGDCDLFVGEADGNINFFRNTGTPADPSYTLEEESFVSAGVGSTGDSGVPIFADIDNDGDFDLFVGEADGRINFFRNIGTATVPDFILEDVSFAGIDVGDNSAPTFADIDNDGDLDLFVGEADGNINFFRNTGTATNPAYTLEDANFAGIDVGGNSAPAFADIDNDGDLDLFVGDIFGRISFFRNTGTAADPTFTLETSNFADIDIGFDSKPTFKDIDNDGDLDLFVGEGNGGLHFFRNVTQQPNISIFKASIDFGEVSVNSQLEKSFTIGNTGTADLMINDIRRASGSDDFTLVSPASFPITIKPTDTPMAVLIRFSPTTAGRKSAMFAIDSDNPTPPVVNVNVSGNKAARGDVNNDGIVDVADLIKVINVILGIGPDPTQEERQASDINDDGSIDIRDLITLINTILGIGAAADATQTLSSYSLATIAIEQLPGQLGSKIEIAINATFDVPVAGIQLKLSFDPAILKSVKPEITTRTEMMALESKVSGTELTVLIYNLSGESIPAGSGSILSIVVTTNVSRTNGNNIKIEEALLVSKNGDELVVNFGTFGSGPTLPKAFFLSQNYPNPFNPATTINFDVSEIETDGVDVKLDVYNVRGQLVKTLVDERKLPGFYSVHWNGTDNENRAVGSGVYYYTIVAGAYKETKKMLIIK